MREIVIERLGRQGDGLAGDVRAPFALPGERVRGAAAGGVMAAPEILAASPDRIAPVCPHFGVCGGCALQHASDPFLAAWKVDIIARALAAHGLSAPMLPTLTAPPRSRRRAVFAGRRTRKTVMVGFHGRRSDEIVDVVECQVLRPEIVAARPALEELTGLAASRSAAVRIGVTSGPAGLDIDLRDAKPADAGLAARAATIAEAHDLARLSWNGDVLALRRQPFQEFGPARVTPPPGAFLQPTAEGAEALAAFARDAVVASRRVIDIFAGCGTLSLPLASGGEVHAVEGEAAMLEALDAGWRAATGLHRVTTERRDLFRRPVLAMELERFDAVSLDPPRAGAEAQTREIARSKVTRVSYISCEPATFARDAAILFAAGFSIERLLPVDQFRWSGHVELAALLTRRETG
jgi:23S rRNA (uracil1939-C5)-methyltransferase